MEKEAKVIPYSEYDKLAELTCFSCGWKGLPSEALREDYDENSNISFDLSCPKCEKMLVVVPYPSVKKDV